VALVRDSTHTLRIQGSMEMTQAGKNAIKAELEVLRRLAREVIQTSKGKRPLPVKDQRALRQQQKRTVEAIAAEITQLKLLRRRVLQARIPDGMAEKLVP
jgi:hypothetical protein